jgi:flagellar motor switch protein FliG
VSDADDMSGTRKAAILLVLLGDDVASDVFKNLPELELRAITQEIADLDYVSPEIAAKVLKEYHQLSMTQEYLAQGGTEYANKLLVKAFGAEGAKGLIEQVTRSQELSGQNLNTLQKTDPQQLAKFIQGEHPQTIALVLAHLNSKTAREVLMMLPENVRGKAVRRLAQMQQFADLLNQIDQEAGTNILETIEQDNAQLATSIRNLMFTFEDFLEVPESGMRELLGQMDKKKLAIALKGASDDLKNHFFKCMSSRAVEMLKEDMETLGPVRSREVNAAQQEAVTVARRLEVEGKMVLKTEQEESYVV